MLFKALKKSNHFSYKTWLASASISLANYSSLDDVLADELAVRKLMTIHAAVDYLASWQTTDANIVKILNNDLCAKWITLRDYALDTLDREYHTLMEAIDKFKYGEWALMPQVPKMTSNTSPYGEASATNSGTNSPAWKAFNDSESAGWNSGKTTYDNDRVQYHFASPIRISRIAVKFRDGSSRAITHTVKFVASNDGSTWADISDNVVTGEINQYKYVDVNTTQAYSYIGMVDLNSPSGHNENAGDGFKLQFYAWAPKGNVPIMTSNTAPYGEVSATDTVGEYYAYKAFNGGNTTSDRWAGNDNDCRIVYKFTNPVCVKRIHGFFGAPNETIVVTYQVQVSNDGTNWTNIGSSFSHAGRKEVTHDVNNSAYYMYVGVHCTYTQSYAGYGSIGQLQFYGREMRVSVPVMTSNTAPYGTVSASTYIETTAVPYMAFDGNESSWWQDSSSNNTNPCWVSYDFGKPVRLGFAKTFKNQLTTAGSGGAVTADMVIEGSNDGTNWTEISDTIRLSCPNNTGANTTPLSVPYIPIFDNAVYSKFRLLLKNKSRAVRVNVTELSFFGFDYSEYDWDADNPRHYLYDHGVEPNETIEPMTSANGWSWSWSLSESVGVKLPNSLYITPPGSGKLTGFGTHDAINLTNYDLFRIVADPTGTTDDCMDSAFTTSKTTFNSGIVSQTEMNSAKEFSLDVSSVSQNAYYTVSTGNKDYRYGYIYEAWLE